MSLAAPPFGLRVGWFVPCGLIMRLQVHRILPFEDQVSAPSGGLSSTCSIFHLCIGLSLAHPSPPPSGHCSSTLMFMSRCLLCSCPILCLLGMLAMSNCSPAVMRSAHPVQSLHPISYRFCCLALTCMTTTPCVSSRVDDD